MLCRIEFQLSNLLFRFFFQLRGKGSLFGFNWILVLKKLMNLQVLLIITYSYLDWNQKLYLENSMQRVFGTMSLGRAKKNTWQIICFVEKNPRKNLLWYPYSGVPVQFLWVPRKIKLKFQPNLHISKIPER